MLNNFFKIFLFLPFSFLFSYAEQFSDSFRLDGYGNVNMFETEGGRDKLDISGGFQGRFQFTDNLAVTGQVHLQEGQNSQGRNSNSLEDYDIELKWLYFDYYLKNDFTFRAGAFQFPVFKSSETGDIGYTYTWTETPLRFYGVFGCDDFEGVELLKNFSYKDFDFLAQVSYGKSENELDDGRGNTREGKVDDLIGLTLKTSHEDFILNVGYLKAKSTMNMREPLGIDSDVDFDMLAFESEVYFNEYTLKTGFIKTNLSNIIPEDLKYYASLEYSFDDITPYILYSKESLDFKETGNDLNNKRSQIKKQYSDSYSLGVRYDYNANLAFKLSYTHDVGVSEFNGFDDERTSNDTFMGSVNVIF